MQQPKVIFVDAVGTLFGVKDSVGTAYADIAQRHGVEADKDALNTAFFKHFNDAESMAFPEAEPTDVPAQEYAWWKAIAVETFEEVGKRTQFDDFEAFFADLYAYFAGADPWVVYPDAYNSLERWRAKGIEIGLISNFDSRIYTVLDALALADFFKSITISTEIGAAKPDPIVFAAALQKHNCQASEAWHVGDSYTDDYEGAQAAGMRGIWLRRPST
ncbi:HAD family hydrolase [Oscillatoria sp. CS-180]|uniref:HAD-IA family hydrolase n=1 Tax=Oscillatoria sp. CS-180 TaxID=3021720 RepID=UPI00232BBC7D|nr:HAD family hydrolase [Oscillatoria sp. CS-180]MDB9526356.1 HAD family hydrolase [Oscillatoria sp. CS-180]